MWIPTPEDVSASWLTDCLRSAGHHGVEVGGFTATRIGTGQIGKCIRFALELANGDGAPRSLVGKFPSDDPVSRQTGIDLGNYRREVEFYRQLRSRLTISTPRCYYAEIDGLGPRFALLLDDLYPAEPGDQLAGCVEPVARAAVLELAGLHAPTWNDPSILGVEWISEPSPETTDRHRAWYQSLLPGFLDRYGHRLEPDSRAILQRVATSNGTPFTGRPQPFALTHVDYRLDNLLIDARRAPPTITVVDWQSITVGQPLSDVAYFLGAGLLPEDRRKCEASIVREYHQRLLAAGVSAYSWSDCWTDYRRGTFAGFLVTVIASMLVQETERGNEMFTVMAQRHSRHALDLGAAEFLS
jgi:Phosphotransferase enzyme family